MMEGDKAICILRGNRRWITINKRNFYREAGVAQLVEHELPKLGVAGSNPVARSIL